ncbi:hypothetical protein BANRA_03382 [Acinetobacter baumannii]|nr:hypothetical protein BANRA_03382 [Acinetobacter baumannii]
MTNFKKHPDGYKSFLGRDDKGLYSVRIGWQVYASNANGSVLYKVKGEVKTPLDVEKFKIDYPKAWNELTQEIEFQRRKQLAIKLRETNIPTYDRKTISVLAASPALDEDKKMTTENSKDNLHIWNAVKQTPTNFLKN